MSVVRYLVDTSALVRLLRSDEARAGWEELITAGLVATCPIVELEFLRTARSKADRDELSELLHHPGDDLAVVGGVGGWVLADRREDAHRLRWGPR